MDVKEFFENKMNLVVILLVVAFFVFGILLLVRLRQIKKSNVEESIPVIVDENMLYLLDEPLKAPPVQFSRKQRKIWQQEEIEWWINKKPFTKEELENLKTKNRELIQKLLDNVP